MPKSCVHVKFSWRWQTKSRQFIKMCFFAKHKRAKVLTSKCYIEIFSWASRCNQKTKDNETKYIRNKTMRQLNSNDSPRLMNPRCYVNVECNQSCLFNQNIHAEWTTTLSCKNALHSILACPPIPLTIAIENIRWQRTRQFQLMP